MEECYLEENVLEKIRSQISKAKIKKASGIITQKENLINDKEKKFIKKPSVPNISVVPEYQFKFFGI
jgi:hypothetical protein